MKLSKEHEEKLVMAIQAVICVIFIIISIFNTTKMQKKALKQIYGRRAGKK